MSLEERGGEGRGGEERGGEGRGWEERGGEREGEWEGRGGGGKEEGGREDGGREGRDDCYTYYSDGTIIYSVYRPTMKNYMYITMVRRRVGRQLMIRAKHSTRPLYPYHHFKLTSRTTNRF